MSFTTEIAKLLTSLDVKLMGSGPDAKHNVGRRLQQAYFWDQVQAYAKKQSDTLWSGLEKDELVLTSNLDPGDHVLAESPHFVVNAKVSERVRRFNADYLADQMKKKFKVSIPIAKQMIESAKQPSNSTTTLKIVEKGV